MKYLVLAIGFLQDTVNKNNRHEAGHMAVKGENEPMHRFGECLAE